MDDNLNFNLLNNHPCVKTNSYGYSWGTPVQTKDDDLLNRLCDYYQKRKNESLDGGSSIWHMNIARHATVINDLENRNLDNLHETFRFLFSSPLAHGFCGGDVTDYRLSHSDKLREDTSFYIFDKLISLAELVGVINVFDPGEYAYVNTFNEYLQSSPERFLTAIMERYDVDLTAPKFTGGMFGLDTSFGVYSERDIFAIAMALHIRGLIKDNGIRICDIGGGAGHLAYYLHKVGFTEISIVDLPTVSLSQMYFLETNIGKDKITLLSPDEFDGYFAVVTNMDSMVEMSFGAAMNYVNRMRGRTDRFISINTEKMTNTFNVKDVCNLTRTSRNLFYLNRGYVMEEYTGV